MRYRHYPFPYPPSLPIRGWGDIDPMFGDTFHLLDGRVVHRGEPLPSDAGPVLPGVLRQQPQFGGDHIPVSAHGSSLCNLLTAKDWAAIRKPRIEAQNHVCEACGRHQNKGLEAHEIWEYHLPEYGKQGIQRLQQIKILCKRCHMMYHLAFANVQGRFEEIFSRLAALQRWDQRRVDAFMAALEKRRDIHNRYSWTLDLSVTPLEILHIQPVWGLSNQGQRVLQMPSKYYPDQMTYTGILGKSWVLHDKEYPAIESPIEQRAA